MVSLNALGADTQTHNIRRGLEPTSFLEAMAKAHCEISEACEAWMLRAETGIAWESYGSGGEIAKPEGVAAEFADVILVLAAKAHELGLDLDAAVVAKARYNAARGASGKRL